mgnify:CR=1 FL=1
MQPKFKLTPEAEKTLKEIAGAVPLWFYHAMEKIEITGEDALNAGFENIEELVKTEEDKEKVFKMKTPAYYQVNHFRRLKKLYQQGGPKAVYDYGDKIYERVTGKKFADKN